MPIEPFEIITVHADGRTEKRMSTPEEISQREADIAQFAAEEDAYQQAIADAEAKRASARAKLSALGLDEGEISAIIR